MGGRVAEEEINFGYEKVTSGASADIKMATSLARAMATEYGMSDKLGPLSLWRCPGRGLPRPLDDAAATPICPTRPSRSSTSEVKRFVEEGYETAQKVIRENIDQLHAIAGALLEFETLSGDEIKGLLMGSSRSARSRPMSPRVRRRRRPCLRPAVARRRRPSPTRRHGASAANLRLRVR